MTAPLHPGLRRRTTIWLAAAGALVAVGCGGMGASSDDDDTGDADGSDQSSAAEPDDWFEEATYTGSGDEVVDLPEGAESGIITASHDGSAAFILNMLDDNNEVTFDAMITTIGSYEGSQAFGLHSMGNEPTKIEVTADGNWEITIAHLSTAPVLELPVDGDGDAVFQYETDAAEWAVTFDGDGAFTVNLSDDAFGGVLEMGPYEGTVAVSAGSGVLSISGDGAWTISNA